MVASAEISSVLPAPTAATSGPPSAVPSGEESLSSVLRAASTDASAPGGAASWKTAIDSDVHGPQTTAPVKNAPSASHSGTRSPSGSSATPQPSTIAVIVGQV